jgi:murein DD-endopeptidase MepM/ murein hydrolase activator NlpD
MSKITRRMVSLLAGIALSFGILIGFQVPAEAASCKSYTYRSQLVRLGSRGPAARSAQCVLRKVGYKLRVDGSFSAADVAKVKDFQRKNRIRRTGNVGPLTWRALIKWANSGRRIAASSSSGKACLPVAYTRIAAGFGATGSWARYHTGIDFSARSGTTVRAPRAGVVTWAGSGGRAGGWAGRYVAIRHSDGTSTLYAHLSATSVARGARVAACGVIGRVGQTGRAFAPHLHFEVYPAGVTAGDVYRAVNPRPWLARLGLRI